MATPTYTDLDLDFAAHPVTGDLLVKTDEEAVKRSIRNLILTGKYDRPFQPHINSRIAKLLFELANPITAIQIRSNIMDTIAQHEPRARVLDVQVDMKPDQNLVAATIVFKILNQPKTTSMRITLERTR